MLIRSSPTELIVGKHNVDKPGSSKVSMTKWCPPENGVKSFENAQAAVDLALRRMKQEKIDLLQCELQTRDRPDEAALKGSADMIP